MSAIRRDGSPDEINPLWDADQERPTDNDRATPCDAGHPGCMGLAAVVLAVPYLGTTPLWLCASCAVVEQTSSTRFHNVESAESRDLCMAKSEPRADRLDDFNRIRR